MTRTARPKLIGIAALAAVFTGAAFAAALQPVAPTTAAQPTTAPSIAAPSASAAHAVDTARGATPTPSEAAAVAPSPSPATPSPSAPDLPPAPFDVVVSADVQPIVDSVGPLKSGGPKRPVGRLEADGATTDVVLDELLVSTRSQAELDGFLARWNGKVLDKFPVVDGITDHLVRVDPSTAPSDPETIASYLASFEDHEGRLRLTDERTLRLLAIMAVETAEHGTTVTLNPLAPADGVAEGVIQDAEDRGNPFTWSYIRGGGNQDFAVGPAWQLLEAKGKLDRTVDVLVNDGGFSSNPDFPDDVTLRAAKWGEENSVDCGDNECPYHGTDVTMTVVGQIDNEYGTVGPAGPVVDELVLVAVADDKWKRLRTLEDMVDQYRPDVVNMSYGSTITAGRAAAEDIFERRYGRMHADGALLVAAAGNKGMDIDQTKSVAGVSFERHLVMPCESKYVLCVGGLNTDSTTRASGSNYGWKDDSRSVEIWGPMRTITIQDATTAYSDLSTRWVGGTSFASPFVAGVGALVKAADPSLGPDDIREILMETANGGVTGQWITGSQRRVDALAAVARALDVQLSKPVVTITNPTHGKDYAVSNWLQLKGTATDYRGEAMPIRWVSSLDGELGNKIGTVSLGELSVGRHVLTATSVDAIGQEGKDQITFDVIRRPVEITIVSPADGTVVEEGDPFILAAGTTDPDNFYAQVAEGDVEWQIRRKSTNTLVWSKKGHDHVVHGSELAPGAYTVTFYAESHDGKVSESRSLTVEALPAGHTKPVVTIQKPTHGKVFNTGGGKVEFQLAGKAVDAENGQLSGKRFRWVATAGNKSVVLCQGSDFAAPSGGSSGGIGGIKNGASKDCSSATVELGVSPLAPGDPTWTIRLEARDFHGDIGVAVVNIDIVVHVG